MFTCHAVLGFSRKIKPIRCLCVYTHTHTHTHTHIYIYIERERERFIIKELAHIIMGKANPNIWRIGQ